LAQRLASMVGLALFRRRVPVSLPPPATQTELLAGRALQGPRGSVRGAQHFWLRSTTSAAPERRGAAIGGFGPGFLMLGFQHRAAARRRAPPTSQAGRVIFWLNVLLMLAAILPVWPPVGSATGALPTQTQGRRADWTGFVFAGHVHGVAGLWAACTAGTWGPHCSLLSGPVS